MLHFGSLGVVTSNSDWDVDGQLDRSEYWAGTHPKDDASCFEARSIAAPAGNTWIVRWHSVSGRTYSVYRSTNLVGGSFVPIQTNIAATPAENVYTDQVSGVDSAAYRIQTP
jgi:hypothetical protein